MTLAAAWAPAVVRTLADAAAVCALGCAALPFLDSGPHRTVLAARVMRPLSVLAAAWLGLELLRLAIMATQAAGRPLSGMSAPAVRLYAAHTGPGLAVTMAAVAAGLLCVRVLTGPRRASTTALALAVVGRGARALSGHVATTPVGVAAIVAHAVSAGLWCGLLAAMVLVVRDREGWARLLPNYSAVALRCVVVLIVTGVVAASLALDSPAHLFTTPYGTVLLIKVAIAVALVLVGWRHRIGWLPAVRDGRSTPTQSTWRAVGESALMGLALAAAATLALTA